MGDTGAARFSETQRFLPRPFSRGLLVLCVAGVAIGLAAGAWRGPEGILLVLLLLLPTLFHLLELGVLVHLDRVEIRFRPLLRRVIPLSSVAACQAIEYRPIREFGGWGVRKRRGRRAYTVSGNHGAELTLHDGQRVLIGSQRADELAGVVSSRLAAAGS
jgi:hypothetical protein